MKNLQIIKTQNNNCYLIDINNKIIQLVNPNLANIHLNKLNEQQCEYYAKKKKYLDKHIKYQNDEVNFNIKEITENDIVNNIITTSQITFEVTDKCNFNCKYCGYGELYNNYDERNTKNASIDNAKSFIDYYYDLCRKNNHVNERLMFGFYGGEPLMNMKFIKEIIKYIEDKGIKPHLYNITTNGSLIKRNIDYLVEKEVNLLISLDGNKFSNSYRVYNNGKDTYDDVVDNIKYIKDKYPDYYQHNVNFSVVLHNKNSVQEISDFFMTYYSKTPYMGRLTTSGVAPSIMNKFDKMSQNTSQFNTNHLNTDEIISKNFLITGHILFLHNNLYSVYNDYLDLMSDIIDKSFYPTSTCSPLSKKIFITVNGKILPCEKIGHNHSLGNIKNGEIKINFQDIIEKYNKMYHYMYNNFCSSCTLIKNCLTCSLQSNNTCPRKKQMSSYFKSELDFFETRRDMYLKMIQIVKLR